jgi:hypothetical protein
VYYGGFRDHVFCLVRIREFHFLNLVFTILLYSRDAEKIGAPYRHDLLGLL